MKHFIRGAVVCTAFWLIGGCNSAGVDNASQRVHVDLDKIGTGESVFHVPTNPPGAGDGEPLDQRSKR